MQNVLIVLLALSLGREGSPAALPVLQVNTLQVRDLVRAAYLAASLRLSVPPLPARACPAPLASGATKRALHPGRVASLAWKAPPLKRLAPVSRSVCSRAQARRGTASPVGYALPTISPASVCATVTALLLASGAALSCWQCHTLWPAGSPNWPPTMAARMPGVKCPRIFSHSVGITACAGAPTWDPFLAMTSVATSCFLLVSFR
mmetsp:Transcript_87139/g.208444  ORF Transcript_87139/g.208444 Transcript_87139/m.208444 type:complete len:205 (-) Transcript_87139:896-1510(-)